MENQFAVGYNNKKYIYGDSAAVEPIIIPLMKPVENIYADGNTFFNYMPTYEAMQEYISNKMEFLQGESVEFEQIHSTYEGMKVIMPTANEMTEEEFDLNLLNQNLTARFAIQQKCPPTIKIIDIDIDHNQWIDTCDSCHEAAVNSKGDLIELLFELKEAGDYDSIKCYPDVYWIADLVSSKGWTEEVHKTYFKNYHKYDLYDLDPREFSSNINRCYNEFYLLH